MLKTIDDLNEEIKEQDKKIDDLEKKICTLENEDNGPIDEKTKKPVKKAVLVKNIDDLKDDNKKLKSDLDQAKKDIEKLEKENDKKDKNLAEENKKLKDEIKELEKEHESGPMDTNTNKPIKKAVLVKKIDELQEENKQLEN